MERASIRKAHVSSHRQTCLGLSILMGLSFELVAWTSVPYEPTIRDGFRWAQISGSGPCPFHSVAGLRPAWKLSRGKQPSTPMEHYGRMTHTGHSAPDLVATREMCHREALIAKTRQHCGRRAFRITHGSFARLFNSANAWPARRPSLVAAESS